MRLVQVCLNLFLFFVINLFVYQSVMAEEVKPPGEIAYEDRIQFVKTLLEKSSAARQIDESGNQEALQRREEARLLFQQAQQEHAADDNDAANKKLIEATKVMFEAVRLAGQIEITAEKKQRDFEDRLDSINALMEAHDRVSEEKGKQTEGIELKQLVLDKVSRANALLKSGQVDEARQVLDEAYIAAKIAINTLRGGDTLVRSLHFETKEEEYNYEIDRNDTHQMLIKILSKDKNASGGVDKMVQNFMDKAVHLRHEAEKQASSGDYEAAIKTLEESTKNLVRALRSSGVYIPG